MHLWQAEQKEIRDKKHNLDNEIRELPFISSKIGDLEKDIADIEKEILS